MFQGTLESNLNEGASVVAAYNALGYVAAAIGITSSTSVRWAPRRRRNDRTIIRAER